MNPCLRPALGWALLLTLSGCEHKHDHGEGAEPALLTEGDVSDEATAGEAPDEAPPAAPSPDEAPKSPGVVIVKAGAPSLTGQAAPSDVEVEILSHPELSQKGKAATKPAPVKPAPAKPAPSKPAPAKQAKKRQAPAKPTPVKPSSAGALAKKTGGAAQQARPAVADEDAPPPRATAKIAPKPISQKVSPKKAPKKKAPIAKGGGMRFDTVEPRAAVITEAQKFDLILENPDGQARSCALGFEDAAGQRVDLKPALPVRAKAGWYKFKWPIEKVFYPSQFPKAGDAAILVLCDGQITDRVTIKLSKARR